VLTPDEVKAIWPLCDSDGLVGAIQHPDDGYIQPADLTQALTKGARARSAEINRNTTVTAIERIAAQTNFDIEESAERFQRDLLRLGIEAELRRSGVVPGDTVRIGHIELEWEPVAWEAG